MFRCRGFADKITDLLLGSTNESNGEFKILSNFARDNVLNLQRGIGLLLDRGFEV